MTIKALFTAIVISFTIANTSTDAKANVPVGELFEAIQLAKEGFELLEPVVKPIATNAAKGIVRFTKKRKQQWDDYRAAKKAKKNAYISTDSTVTELDMDTVNDVVKIRSHSIDEAEMAINIKQSKSVPEKLTEEAEFVKPAPLIRSRSMPADLAELGL